MNIKSQSQSNNLFSRKQTLKVPKKSVNCYFIIVSKLKKKKKKKKKIETHRRHWLPWLSSIVATVGVRLAVPVRISLLPPKISTIVRIEVGQTLSTGRYLSDLLWYEVSFNRLLTKLLEKTQLPSFDATDNRNTELYSYACSSGEQNVAISYIIVRLTYSVFINSVTICWSYKNFENEISFLFFISGMK